MHRLTTNPGRAAGGLAALPPEVLETMADALRVLAHAQRLRLADVLDREGALPVYALMQKLGLPQASVSTHLNKMRRAGLVGAERRGKEVWYGLADRNALTIPDLLT